MNSQGCGSVSTALRGRRSQGYPGGVTLVELLVVLGLILLLVGLVTSVIGRARAGARQAACASNLRQIAQAVRMYAEDHDGMPPNRPTVGFPLDPGPQRIVDSLARYGATSELWFCPADPDRGRDVYKDRVQHWVTSYHYHGWSNYVGDRGGPDGTVEPPDIIAMNDTARWLSYWIAADARHQETYGRVSDHSSWHAGGFNVVYADGHVRWVPLLKNGQDIPNPFMLEQTEESRP